MNYPIRREPRRQAWEPPEADPLPAGFLPGPPPPELCDRRFPTVPPLPADGFTRPTATTRGWLVACPSCHVAWAAVVPLPDGGFELHADPGCSWACDATDLRFRHAALLGTVGTVFPELAIERDAKARAYCRAALLKACERVARNPRSADREAFGIGRLLPAAGVSARAAAHALANAAGTDPADLLPNVEAGTARPRRR